MEGEAHPVVEYPVSSTSPPQQPRAAIAGDCFDSTIFSSFIIFPASGPTKPTTCCNLCTFTNLHFPGGEKTSVLSPFEAQRWRWTQQRNRETECLLLPVNMNTLDILFKGRYRLTRSLWWAHTEWCLCRMHITFVPVDADDRQPRVRGFNWIHFLGGKQIQ